MDSILNLYNDYDVAVVPTLWSEGTSLACVEAVCAGLPVVATPVGGLGNLIVPYFNGLLAEPSPLAIARAIEEAAESRLWNRMHRNCLGMGECFGKKRWESSVLDWLKG